MGNRKYTQSPRNYYKTNYVELVELITPEVYKSKDLELSGTELNPVSDLINRHVQLADNVANIISISGVEGTQTENLGNISGISQYFVKQNELTKINPFLFETKILLPLGQSLSNFDTSSEFEAYLSGTLLPQIIPASQTEVGSLEDNIGTLSALTSSTDASSIHNHLVDTLGWFYFLNTSADGDLSYSPSSYVLESLTELYVGKDLGTFEGVKGLTEYVWKNNETCSFGSYIPPSFVSGAADAVLDPSDGVVATYTSGTQKLDSLNTLVEVVYSPLYIDQQDFAVKEAFDSFMDAGTELDDQVSKGPHRKFTNMLGYQFADISDEVESLELLYDIDGTPDEQLQYIAELIGFKLRGNSAAKWRHQLRIAIDLYKKSGTLEAVQTAINALIVDSVFDVSAQAQELWESYIPFLIWYSLGTESPLFRSLDTWTPIKAIEGGVYDYSASSLEENLKMVTDSILLDAYKAYPDNFLFHGQVWPVPRFHKLDKEACEGDRYTIVGDPAMRPFYAHLEGEDGYAAYKQLYKLLGYSKAWEAAYADGPLGRGVYLAGESPRLDEADQIEPIFLKFRGDLEFFFNFRGRNNYPIPPFEEVKYFRDSTVSKPLVDVIVERLKCFQVRPDFADEVGDYIVSSAVTDETDLGALNEFLFFFSGVQTAPNFNQVMLSISDYEKNLLPLWNGKSSHLFVNFKDTDFDFSKTTLEGDGKYALYEAARVTREFSPAHAITRVNLTASAQDPLELSSTKMEYTGFDQDDNRSGYASSAVLANFENNGLLQFAFNGLGDDNRGSEGGRGGLNAFKRNKVNDFADPFINGVSVVNPATVGRRALRRRNLKYLLPHEGYYDRTGFNGPVSFDPSTLEHSVEYSLGALTLGYVASAGKFHPVVDPVDPSGIWNECEGLMSSRTFSGIDTSTTFPYRGLSPLGSNAKMPEITATTARYIDRSQVPEIYNTMHELFESKAVASAEQTLLNTSAYDVDSYWKNNVQSLANESIADGLVLNSFEDYENFKFGKGIHNVHRDYCKYFSRHALGANEIEKTGGNIFGHVFGRGLFNGDLNKDGEFVSNLVASSIESASAIDSISVWREGADGTYVADQSGQAVLPISGTFIEGNVNNAEFRNPTILSGIEFVDTSGAPSGNSFTIFELEGNRKIKSKALGGLPRLRFDLSAYGDRRNYFIKDHKFSLDIKAQVADEDTVYYGVGRMGVWIHTDPVDGLIWSWTPRGKWEPIREDRLSILNVVRILSHQHGFKFIAPDEEDNPNCLANTAPGVDPNTSLKNFKDSFLENVNVTFDTRNFTDRNGSEYLKIIPIEETEYVITEQVHRDDTNYVVEIFFMSQGDESKYLLIDDIQLQDLTLRDEAGVGTGYGVESSGTPLRPFVKEDKLELSKDQLRDILKFYNGMIGKGVGQYATNLASRDATITSNTLETSGGSRLTYREHPEWGPFTPGDHGNYTEVRLDN